MASNIVAVNDLNAETVVKLLEDGAAGVTLSLPQQKPEDIAARIAARDFSAQTADELFGGNEAESSKEWIGRPFHLVDVEFLPSDIPDAPLPFFALLKVATLDGESKTITTGAATLVRKVAVAKAKGFLPLTLKIVEGNKTANGYTPLDLVKVSEKDLPF